MSADPSPIDSRIRDYIRRDIQDFRANSRHSDLDTVRCGLGEIVDVMSNNITQKDVQGLAARIKRRKRATSNDLIRLSKAFMRDSENISTFMRIPGAINVVIKEFTGQDADLRLWATECLCNLSLGDDFCCEKLALMAGTYLLSYVKSSNKHLARLCLWVLCNLVCGGGKPLKILMSQEIVRELISVVQNDYDENIKNESLNCLQLIVSREEEVLSDADNKIIVNAVTEEKNPETLGGIQLLDRYLIRKDFQLTDHTDLAKIIAFCTHYLTKYPRKAPTKDIALGFVIYSIRILANFSSVQEEAAQIFIQQFNEEGKLLSTVISELIESTGQEEVTKELLWFVGNLHNSPFPVVQQYIQRDNLAHNTKFPIITSV
ncbi:uncharacterized protein LOC132261841 [Phlebotomus argentipes]|uniref:uncharacterized protein LOC132261841 n=1 Tax=Phlebotomus argentipes TaxID=94469 RepID=UPI0028933C13|nr:uncharacterized protein LOC132261841 [Phlebotomus argentipes]